MSSFRIYKNNTSTKRYKQYSEPTIYATFHDILTSYKNSVYDKEDEKVNNILGISLEYIIRDISFRDVSGKFDNLYETVQKDILPHIDNLDISVNNLTNYITDVVGPSADRLDTFITETTVHINNVVDNIVNNL